MKALTLVLFGVWALPAVALAAMPSECQVAANQVENSFALPQVRKAIAGKKLDIVVIGAGSSQLPGAEGAARSYPARLQSALTETLPGVAVTVTGDIKSRRMARDMLPGVKAVAGASAKPALMVWQTGTVDALRAVEPEEFSATLSKGVGSAKKAGIDVVLMNMQYSPRTESMIALNNYAESMRWVALRYEIPLFDRFHVMKLWNELGTFDLYSDTKKMDTAERVHDCIGRLLADMVVNAAEPDGAKPPLDVK